MTFKTDDRVFETSETTGNGEYTLAGAQVGFQSFSVMGAGNLCPYAATDDVDWETGIGTILAAPARLARTTVLSSSNGGAAIVWGVGTKKIRCSPLAGLAVPRTLSKDVAGGAGTTVLTQDEQRRQILIFTGALTGNRVIEVDQTPWSWEVVNDTTGNFTLVLKVAGQPGAEFYQGRATRAACTGVDVRKVSDDPPPGIILEYAADAVIAGYAVACDGANISRTGANSALFNKIGTTWGVGDGATTFGTPDSRRRTAVGKGGAGTGTLGNAVGNVGGAETHALSIAELAAHTHTTDSQGAHTHGINAEYNASNGGQTNELPHSANNGIDADISTSSDGAHTHTAQSTGSGTAHNIVQPSYVVTKMIKL